MAVIVPVSDLVVADTPLTGAELVPVVQDGVTKQATAAAFGLSDGSLLWADQSASADNVNSTSAAAVLVEETTALDHAHINGAGKLVIDEVGIYTGSVFISVQNFTTTGALRASGIQLDITGTTDILGTGIGVVPAGDSGFNTQMMFTFSAVPTVDDVESFVNQAVVGDAYTVSASWTDMSLGGIPTARWDLYLFKIG